MTNPQRPLLLNVAAGETRLCWDRRSNKAVLVTSEPFLWEKFLRQVSSAEVTRISQDGGGVWLVKTSIEEADLTLRRLEWSDQHSEDQRLLRESLPGQHSRPSWFWRQGWHRCLYSGRYEG